MHLSEAGDNDLGGKLLLRLLGQLGLDSGDLVVPGLLDLRPVLQELLLALLALVEVVRELLLFGQCPLRTVKDLQPHALETPISIVPRTYVIARLAVAVVGGTSRILGD